MEFRQRYSVTRRGFTLVEVLLTMSIFGLLVGGSTMALTAAHRRAAQSAVAEQVLTRIEQAKHQSVSARDGQNWGIKCTGNAIQMFSFTSTTLTVGDATTLGQRVTCTAGTEVRFQKLTGVVETPATFTLSADGRAFQAITISAPSLIQTTTL